MHFEKLAKEPRQRRQEVGCLAIAAVLLGGGILALWVSSQSGRQAAADLCKGVKVGAPFDQSRFTKIAQARGFDTYLRKGPKEDVLLSTKTVLARLRYSCGVYLHGPIATKVEVSTAPE